MTAFAEKFPLFHALVIGRRPVLAAFAASFAALAAAVYGWQILTSNDLFTPAGTIIGGDFMVFHFAAGLAGGPESVALYDASAFSRLLSDHYPGHGDFLLAWMYPPTMSLIIAPFALAPYLPSFALWVALFGGLFLFTAYRLWPDKWALFFVAACPAAFQALICGQNGFLTASLIVAAGAFADRRPLLAGLAAGLLTIKPQLGLLIPIAFMAGGCWRAFASAAATALAIAALSLAVYGSDPWLAFAASLSDRGGLLGTSVFPNNKLVSPFGLAIMLGAPATFAGAVQIAATIGLSGYVFIIWRRVRDWDLRLAALTTSALLATPYAFYYELVVAAPAMLLIARRGVAKGFLPCEKQALIAVWVLPLFAPGFERVPSLSVSALAALAAFMIAARRCVPAAGLTNHARANPNRLP